MKKPRPTKVSGIPEKASEPSNRLYVSLREIGECNEKGKSVFAMGYRGKFVSEPNKPLQTMVAPLISEIMKCIHYEDQKAVKEDIKKFKEWVNSIHAD